MSGRKTTLAVLGLAALLAAGLTAPAMADTSAHGEQHVYVIVDSNITIGGLTQENGDWVPGPGNDSPSVSLGRIQTGMFCGWIRWRVDANTEAVRFCFAASDLWKGDDPVGATVLPIPLYLEGGAEFDIEFGNAALGQSPLRPFVSQSLLGDFPVWQTDYVTFESSQNGHFSQYVTTHVCWYQDDAEKPTGQYSGVVALWGFVVPQLGPA
jgi:hypothetical protein